MKRHKIFPWQIYASVLLFGLMFCLIGGCQAGKKTDNPEVPVPPEPKPKVEPRYEQGTMLLITSGGYSYLAYVTADTLPDATKVPVQVFNKKIHDTLGGTVGLEAVTTTREKPPEGWGTRKIALEYFDGTSWIYTTDALETEDLYILTDKEGKTHALELADVRFPPSIRLKNGGIE